MLVTQLLIARLCSLKLIDDSRSIRLIWLLPFILMVTPTGLAAAGLAAGAGPSCATASPLERTVIKAIFAKILFILIPLISLKDDSVDA